MKISLRARMLLLALLPATLVAVLLTTVFLLRAIDDLERGLDTRGTAISRQMATAAEFGIFSGQRASLSALTESALRIDPDVRGAAIIDMQGTIMARSGELNLAAWPGLVRTEVHRHEADVRSFIEPVMRKSLPVDDIYAGGVTLRDPPPTIIGYAVVEVSLQNISDRNRRLMAVSAVIALLGSVLGGWLALRIAHTVTKPLLEAGEVVARIGDGDLTARMSVDSAGALQSLATGINHMAGRIGVTQEELRERVTDATLDLLREKEAAEHATIAKTHFLAAASHDLRQPLHALGLFVSGLAQSKVAKQEPKLVAHIQSAVDTLQNLLDSILDISRLDGGDLVPQISDFPLNDLLERMARDLSLLAEQKGLQLRVKLTRAWARSDPKLVERILLNLVGNALRYTRTGGVLVSCRRRRDKLRVEVWDTGEGIPQHAHEEIFEDYVQLGNPERDRAKGLGLGLAICRRLSGLLSIPMGVRSRPGRGSVFWIELPMVEAVAPSLAPVVDALPAEQPSDHTRIVGTVLVVDDDMLVRAGMEQAILTWGGRVLLAANREEALRCCRESALLPDLMICALRLPGKVSGIDLAQELQREFGLMGVLLVSADIGEEAQTAARHAGFLLLKEPVPPGRLRAALRHLLTGN
ncbi:MAG: ATP-binding protein [Sulfuritalea sp.]|jgi:signal transduction histidine kinase|nr:ATP-binding protein [Sulfuritalea sp.]